MSDTGTPPPATRLRARLSSALAARFGIDARALAALRISLGLLLLADLLLRARHLEAFYTDAGMFPRALLYDLYPTLSQLSIHTLSGAAWFQVLLFLLAGLCALSLLLGYRTRTVALLSFVLLVSLHARNPDVLNGGDSLLRRLLFWGLFLPLGERWSLDAFRRSGAPRERIATLASAALLVQIVLVYAVNAVFKLRSDLWLRGEAVRYILSLQQLTIFLGDALTQFPVLLRAFDWLWLGMVIVSPLLILLIGRLRTALVALFASMHLGMFLTMRIGLFPLVSIAALLAFVPSPVWDRAVDRFSAPVESAATRLGVPARLNRFRSEAPPNSAVSRHIAALRRWGGRVAPAVVAVLLAVILVWNAIAVGFVSMPGEGEPALDPADHSWDMFAPYPPTSDGWYAAPGELESGERVDAYYLSPPIGDERPDTLEMYPSSRWRKYLVSAHWSGDEDVQREFAGYLCERWNRNHDDDELRNVTVFYVEQPTRFDEPEPTERVELLRYNCSSGA